MITTKPKSGERNNIKFREIKNLGNQEEYQDK